MLRATSRSSPPGSWSDDPPPAWVPATTDAAVPATAAQEEAYLVLASTDMVVDIYLFGEVGSEHRPTGSGTGFS